MLTARCKQSKLKKTRMQQTKKAVRERNSLTINSLKGIRQICRSQCPYCLQILNGDVEHNC